MISALPSPSNRIKNPSKSVCDGGWLARWYVNLTLNMQGILKSLKLRRGEGEQLPHWRKSPLIAMFLHSKQQNRYQGTQELTPVGSKPSLGPSMDHIGPIIRPYNSQIVRCEKKESH